VCEREREREIRSVGVLVDFYVERFGWKGPTVREREREREKEVKSVVVLVESVVERFWVERVHCV